MCRAITALAFLALVTQLASGKIIFKHTKSHSHLKDLKEVTQDVFTASQKQYQSAKTEFVELGVVSEARQGLLPKKKKQKKRSKLQSCTNATSKRNQILYGGELFTPKPGHDMYYDFESGIQYANAQQHQMQKIHQHNYETVHANKSKSGDVETSKFFAGCLDFEICIFGSVCATVGASVQVTLKTQPNPAPESVTAPKPYARAWQGDFETLNDRYATVIKTPKLAQTWMKMKKSPCFFETPPQRLSNAEHEQKVDAEACMRLCELKDDCDIVYFTPETEKHYSGCYQPHYCSNGGWSKPYILPFADRPPVATTEVYTIMHNTLENGYFKKPACESDLSKLSKQDYKIVNFDEEIDAGQEFNWGICLAMCDADVSCLAVDADFSGQFPCILHRTLHEGGDFCAIKPGRNTPDKPPTPSSPLEVQTLEIQGQLQIGLKIGLCSSLSMTMFVKGAVAWLFDITGGKFQTPYDAFISALKEMMRDMSNGRREASSASVKASEVSRDMSAALIKARSVTVGPQGDELELLRNLHFKILNEYYDQLSRQGAAHPGHVSVNKARTILLNSVYWEVFWPSSDRWGKNVPLDQKMLSDELICAKLANKPGNQGRPLGMPHVLFCTILTYGLVIPADLRQWKSKFQFTTKNIEYGSATNVMASVEKLFPEIWPHTMDDVSSIYNALVEHHNAKKALTNDDLHNQQKTIFLTYQDGEPIHDVSGPITKVVWEPTKNMLRFRLTQPCVFANEVYQALSSNQGKLEHHVAFSSKAPKFDLRTTTLIGSIGFTFGKGSFCSPPPVIIETLQTYTFDNKDNTWSGALGMEGGSFSIAGSLGGFGMIVTKLLRCDQTTECLAISISYNFESSGKKDMLTDWAEDQIKAMGDRLLSGVMSWSKEAFFGDTEGGVQGWKKRFQDFMKIGLSQGLKAVTPMLPTGLLPTATDLFTDLAKDMEFGGAALKELMPFPISASKSDFTEFMISSKCDRVGTLWDCFKSGSGNNWKHSVSVGVSTKYELSLAGVTTTLTMGEAKIYTTNTLDASEEGLKVVEAGLAKAIEEKNAGFIAKTVHKHVNVTQHKKHRKHHRQQQRAGH